MVLELVSRGLAKDNRRHAKAIEEIVERESVALYTNFKAAHIAKIKSNRGIWASGGNNPFVGSLFSAVDLSQNALQRSLETSAGKTFEVIAREVGKLSYEVRDTVPIVSLTDEQQKSIAKMIAMLDSGFAIAGDPGALAELKDSRPPGDYRKIFERLMLSDPKDIVDGEFTDERDVHHLVQIKASGKLNKVGARAEKLELLTAAVGYQNHLKEQDVGYLQKHPMDIHLCTALDGDIRAVSSAVRQYWRPEELLLGADFWKFVTQLDNGGSLVMRVVRRVAQDVGRDTMEEIISEAYPPTLSLSDEDDEVEGDGLEL